MPRDTDWGDDMIENDSIRIARLMAEMRAIYRENENRDKKIEEMSKDVKRLLELANQSKGGFWVGMALVSAISSVIGWAASHLKGF